MIRSNLALCSMVMVASLAGCGPLDDAGELGQTVATLLGGTFTSERPEVGRIYTNVGQCTATLVGPQLVLTAAHCVDYVSHEDTGYWGRFVIDAGQEPRSFIITRSAAYSWLSGADDLALLELLDPVPGSLATPAIIADREPAPGSNATIYGYGCQDRSNPGLVKKQKIQIRWGDLTFAGCPGDSGGPTITDDGAVVRVNSAYRRSDGRDVFALVYRHTAEISGTAARWGRTLGPEIRGSSSSRYALFRARLPTTTLNSQIWACEDAPRRCTYVRSPEEYGRFGIAADESNVQDVPWPTHAFQSTVYLSHPDQLFWIRSDTPSGLEGTYPEVPISATQALRTEFAAGRIVPVSATGWAVLLQQGVIQP